MSFETRQKAKYEGNNWWHWSVWIEGSSKELDSIQSVTYILHPTFPNRIRKIDNRSSKFKLDSGGWGEFRIRMILELRSGEKVQMSHELDLSYPERSQKAPARGMRATPIGNVFISSSATDAPTKAIIRQILQEKKIKPKDASELSLDAPLEISVRNAIGDSDALIAVRSDVPNSWVDSEVAFAKSKGIPVITVDSMSKQVSIESLGSQKRTSSLKDSSALNNLSASLGESLKR